MSEDNTPDEADAFLAEAGEAELSALKAENAALKEQILRYAAEAENTRRRAEREANDARAYAIQKFARDLLGVADNLSRALAHEPADGGDPAIKNFVLGVEMTEKELLGAFERNGLKRIAPARGDKFDPHQHQAMAEVPGTDVPAGGVVEVMQPGYELLGRLVRPAMVMVAAKEAGAQPDAPKPGGAGPNPYASGDEADPGGSVDRRA
ncbi:MAG TPA: nucleotide exchange factor GrpE [Phenylobacterium sp.]|jgi:molecular chaperone GrpE|uniref:nucleotide exchange factor GrpE n=1 Tax=Phenylobacterium sp. TaxID=1871053 RepID=UPI002C0C09B8|nr:nucleotide exchange factor GrpE [Phenylobacterium sp.]HXA40946.1 nucleotide exchange factor GrpE [Phenylobacterium sp.]